MPTITPQPSVDARGRAIPIDSDEAGRRASEALRALVVLDEMGDEDERRATFEALAKGVDDRRLSDRPRFEG